MEFPQSVIDIINDIRSIKIQGASNVAKATIEAIKLYLNEMDFKDTKTLVENVSKLGLELMNVRPTEPMTRGVVNDVINYSFFILSSKSNMDVEEAKSALISKLDNLIKYIDEMKQSIAEIGANLIEDGFTIATYCHSSKVVSILKRAHDLGKDIKVIVHETRPLFQGRITAKELSQHGIDVTFVVDGGVGSYGAKADIALVGGDAVTAMGDLINKIGTSALAKVMYVHRKPFYSAVEIFKYDALTAKGLMERIEERDPGEVWDNPPKGVNVINPAFDITPSRFITAYITNVGLVPPQSIQSAYEKAMSEL